MVPSARATAIVSENSISFALLMSLVVSIWGCVLLMYSVWPSPSVTLIIVFIVGVYFVKRHLKSRGGGPPPMAIELCKF